MTALGASTCPGCRLQIPASQRIVYDGKFHTSPECWSIFTEVVGAELGNAVLFGQVHQLTVDTYAVQHAGGRQPDTSIDVHLAGLHLVLVRGIAPPAVPPLLQRLAAGVREWPHFPPPAGRGSLTVFDVAMADSMEEHVSRVRAWTALVWAAWSDHHAAVAELVRCHIGLA
jgi:hypothetical protein